jgi:hypothetical protein
VIIQNDFIGRHRGIDRVAEKFLQTRNWYEFIVQVFWHFNHACSCIWNISMTETVR